MGGAAAAGPGTAAAVGGYLTAVPLGCYGFHHVGSATGSAGAMASRSILEGDELSYSNFAASVAGGAAVFYAAPPAYAAGVTFGGAMVGACTGATTAILACAASATAVKYAAGMTDEEKESTWKDAEKIGHHAWKLLTILSDDDTDARRSRRARAGDL